VRQAEAQLAQDALSVTGKAPGRAHYTDCTENDPVDAGRGDLISGFHMVSSLFVPLLPKADLAKCYGKF